MSPQRIVSEDFDDRLHALSIVINLTQKEAAISMITITQPQEQERDTIEGIPLGLLVKLAKFIVEEIGEAKK